MKLNPKGAALRLLLGAAMAFFFLPFVSLSCGKSLSVKASGFQLVKGGKTPRVDSLIGEGEIKQEPLAGVAFLFGAAALLISFAGHRGFNLLGAACSATSSTSLVLMKSKFESLI